MKESKVSTFVSKACKHFDNATYTQRTSYYKDKSRPELRDFVQYLYNAASRYIETGTIQHLNNAIAAGRGQGRQLITVRIMKTVSAHAWKGKNFGGKMDKAVMAKKTQGWEHTFMLQVQAELDRDVKVADAQSEWDMDNAMLTFVKKALGDKGGKHTAKQIKESLESAIIKAVAA